MVDIRIDVDMPDKGKTRRLVRSIGDHGLACLFRLWMYCGKHCTKGTLHGLSNDDIEEIVGWKGDPGVFVSTLADEVWLDKVDGTGEWAVHDWKDHQPWIYYSEDRSEIARVRAVKRWGKAKGVKVDPAEGKEKKVDLEDVLPVKEIIEYLNAKSGKKFSHTSRATKRHIAARWKEGFGIEEFKRVIEYQCAKWTGDPKMEEYLRPETLFGTKFESYLNAPPDGSGKGPRGTDTAGRVLEELV